MDFTFTDEQEALRGLAAQILADRVTPGRLDELERTAEPDRQVWKDFAAAGLLALALPESVGGSGYGIMELSVVIEQVGRHLARVPYWSTLVLGALPIVRFGSADLQAEVLPPVAAGDAVLTAALEETGSSDPLRPDTQATNAGDVWTLTGTKVVVPWAPLADRIVVSARTPEGTALFLVTPDDERTRVEPAVGTDRLPQGTLELHDAPAVLLSDSAGADDAVGWLYRHAVAGQCATAVGVVDEALRITAGYVSSREQFGRPLATFQAVSLRLADTYIDVEAIRAAAWSAIWRLAEGRDAEQQLAIAKFWVADGGQRIAHACQHLHGGIGVDVSYPIHRYFLWAKDLELRLGGETPQLLRLGAAMAAAV